MDMLISIFIVFLMVLPWKIIALLAKRRQRLADEPNANDETNLAYAEAFYLVKNAYDSLTNQRARGYGPWLSSIIDRSIRYEIVHDERGRVHIAYEGSCPIDVALAAMFKTRDELVSSRFDLSEVNRAITQLMSM